MKPMNQALGASILFDTRNKALFRVICKVSREDGEDQPNLAVGAEDFDAIGPNFDKWLKQHAHTVVKKLVLNRRPLGC